MDPINRRHIWGVIQNAKPGRAIVLTTHSLEEADMLGDKVAIMAQGSLQSIGRSLCLKRKFGAGYHVSVTLKACGGPGGRSLAAPACDEEIRRRRCKSYIRQTVLGHVMALMSMEDNGDAIEFRVPRGSDDALCAILEQLESRSDELGLSSIDVSLPTLEEVFMEVMATATRAERGIK